MSLFALSRFLKAEQLSGATLWSHGESTSQRAQQRLAGLLRQVGLHVSVEPVLVRGRVRARQAVPGCSGQKHGPSGGGSADQQR